jgi:tryptophanyl-tRNA synthetase
MSIVTDSTAVDAPKNPDNSTIVALYRLFATESDLLKMEGDFRAGGFGYGDFKKRLFEVIWNCFAPMRSRRELLLSDPGSVDKILQEGADRARAVAEKTICRVRDAVGIRPLN